MFQGVKKDIDEFTLLMLIKPFEFFDKTR